jgi:hypothetical protein
MKKLLLIAILALGTSLPVFAQDEPQVTTTDETQSVTAQSATDEGFLGRRRAPHRHRSGPNANRRHRNHKVLPNPIVPPIPPGCTYSFVPDGAHALAAGDTDVVTVTTPTGCPVYAVSNSSFIHITGVTGNTVTFTVDPNTTFFTRNGSVNISGHTYGVGQDGHDLNFDGTYDVTFTILVYCPGSPPVGLGPYYDVWVVVGGVVTEGIQSGTISDFGEVNISAPEAGLSVNFTGSIDQTGHGLGLVNVANDLGCSAGGNWSATRR